MYLYFWSLVSDLNNHEPVVRLNWKFNNIYWKQQYIIKEFIKVRISFFSFKIDFKFYLGCRRNQTYLQTFLQTIGKRDGIGCSRDSIRTICQTYPCLSYREEPHKKLRHQWSGKPPRSETSTGCTTRGDQ